MDSGVVSSANEWEIYVYIRKDINITGFDDIEGEGGRERITIIFLPFQTHPKYKKNKYPLSQPMYRFTYLCMRQ